MKCVIFCVDTTCWIRNLFIVKLGRDPQLLGSMNVGIVRTLRVHYAAPES